MNNKFTLLLLLLGLISCLESYSGGVLGPDKDNDGVRDDVQEWIEKSFKNPNQAMAYKQYAKALRHIHEHSKNKKKSILAIRMLSRSRDCERLLRKQNPTYFYLWKRKREHASKLRRLIKKYPGDKKTHKRGPEYLKEYYKLEKEYRADLDRFDPIRNVLKTTLPFEEIISKMNNTRERKRNYNEAYRNFGGQTVFFSNDYKEVCEFEPVKSNIELFYKVD